MNLRLTLIINGLCALVLAAMYGSDALDALRVQSAAVTAYIEPPNLVFALGALLAMGVGVGATVMGVAQKRGLDWRGFRLMPIITVVVLFVDLFIFAAAKSPLDASARTALTLHTLAEAATQAASPDAVPQSPPQLQELAEQFGAPPYRVHGEPAKAWAVVVRKGCSGPVTEVKTEPVGTLFYCVAADGKKAWITAVGLPVTVYFGPPQLFSNGGVPIVGVVNVRVPEEPDPGPDAPPPGDLAGVDRGPGPWFETPDSGR